MIQGIGDVEIRSIGNFMVANDQSLAVSDLITIARALQNRPRISLMEDTAAQHDIVALLDQAQRTFKEVEDGDYLLAQAASYAQSGHFELSLAAIRALLMTHGNMR